MKKALTGAQLFSGKEFADNKALLFENEKIVDVYHFFDPTLLDAELAASQK